MLVHGAEPFAKANDRDFEEHETIAYTLIIPGEEPISQHFRGLEEACYNEVISTEDRDLEKVKQIVSRQLYVPSKDFHTR